MLAVATSASMVLESGVSWLAMAGVAEQSTAGTSGVVSASTFQALPDGASAKVSSPIGIGARNSSDAEPPIGPDIANTGTYLRSRRRKMRS